MMALDSYTKHYRIIVIYNEALHQALHQILVEVVTLLDGNCTPFH